MTQGFEFVDHPADIQVHSWGTKFEGALESQAIALFETMFDTSKFKDDIQKTISIQANDLYALVFQFLDEWLFIFDTEDFVLKSVKITKCDLENFKIEATANGEEYDQERHADFRRTEVKAITYGSMKVDIQKDKTEIYVIFDL